MVVYVVTYGTYGQPKMETKLEKLKKMWAAGQYRAALKLAASWHELGDHKDKITQGWAAATHAKFYRQIGKDPVGLYTAGLEAVAERYGLPAPDMRGIAL